MTQIQHDTFVIEHNYGAGPSQVFKAWSSADAIGTWAPPMEGMVFEYTKFDFTPGEAFQYRCGPGGAMVINGHYLAIDQNRSIIFVEVGQGPDGGTNVMTNSVEMVADGAGTRLTMTVQIAAADATAARQGAEFGWGKALENLANFVG